MRSVFALVLLALPATGLTATLAGEDRYGPARGPSPISQPATTAAAAASGPAPTTPYGGQLLTWANKSQPRIQPAVAPMPAARASALVTPSRAPPARFYAAPSAPVVAQSQIAVPAPYVAPAIVAVAPSRAPAPSLYAPRAEADSQSRVAAIAPDAAAVVLRPLQSVSAPTPRPIARIAAPARTQAAAAVPVLAQASAPAPKAHAAIAKPPPAAPSAAAPPSMLAENAPAAAAPSAPVRTRFYSLHREYGDTPDAIAMPVDRPMVLVGPSEVSKPATDEHADDQDAKPGKSHGDDAADAAH